MNNATRAGFLVDELVGVRSEDYSDFFGAPSCAQVRWWSHDGAALRLYKHRLLLPNQNKVLYPEVLERYSNVSIEEGRPDTCISYVFLRSADRLTLSMVGLDVSSGSVPTGEEIDEFNERKLTEQVEPDEEGWLAFMEDLETGLTVPEDPKE